MAWWFIFAIIINKPSLMHIEAVKIAHWFKKKKKSLSHSFNTFFLNNKKKRMMLATPGLFHYNKGKAVKTSDILTYRHKIFEYSFTATAPGIISTKRSSCSFHTLFRYGYFLRTASSPMVTWNWNTKKQTHPRERKLSL